MNARDHLPAAETGEPAHAPPGALGIVVLADRASRVGGTATLAQHVTAAVVGRVTLIGAGVRVRPRVVRAVERLVDVVVTRPMDDAHRLPYLAGGRGVIIVLLGLAAPLVDHLAAARHGDVLLRHHRRFHAQRRLESHRRPFTSIARAFYEVAVWIPIPSRTRRIRASDRVNDNVDYSEARSDGGSRNARTRAIHASALIRYALR